MATQSLTYTRWTCDRCGTMMNNPKADERGIPVAWACIVVTFPDAVEPVTKDLCPACAGELNTFLKGDQ